MPPPPPPRLPKRVSNPPTPREGALNASEDGPLPPTHRPPPHAAAKGPVGATPDAPATTERPPASPGLGAQPGGGEPSAAAMTSAARSNQPLHALNDGDRPYQQLQQRAPDAATGVSSPFAAVSVARDAPPQGVSNGGAWPTAETSRHRAVAAPSPARSPPHAAQGPPRGSALPPPAPTPGPAPVPSAVHQPVPRPAAGALSVSSAVSSAVAVQHTAGPGSMAGTLHKWGRPMETALYIAMRQQERETRHTASTHHSYQDPSAFCADVSIAAPARPAFIMSPAQLPRGPTVGDGGPVGGASSSARSYFYATPNASPSRRVARRRGVAAPMPTATDALLSSAASSRHVSPERATAPLPTARLVSPRREGPSYVEIPAASPAARVPVLGASHHSTSRATSTTTLLNTHINDSRGIDQATSPLRFASPLRPSVHRHEGESAAYADRRDVPEHRPRSAATPLPLPNGGPIRSPPTAAGSGAHPNRRESVRSPSRESVRSGSGGGTAHTPVLCTWRALSASEAASAGMLQDTPAYLAHHLRHTSVLRSSRSVDTSSQVEKVEKAPPSRPPLDPHAAAPQPPLPRAPTRTFVISARSASVASVGSVQRDSQSRGPSAGGRSDTDPHSSASFYNYAASPLPSGMHAAGPQSSVGASASAHVGWYSHQDARRGASGSPAMAEHTIHCRAASVGDADRVVSPSRQRNPSAMSAATTHASVRSASPPRRAALAGFQALLAEASMHFEHDRHDQGNATSYASGGGVRSPWQGYSDLRASPEGHHHHHHHAVPQQRQREPVHPPDLSPPPTAKPHNRLPSDASQSLPLASRLVSPRRENAEAVARAHEQSLDDARRRAVRLAFGAPATPAKGLLGAVLAKEAPSKAPVVNMDGSERRLLSLCAAAMPHVTVLLREFVREDATARGTVPLGAATRILNTAVLLHTSLSYPHSRGREHSRGFTPTDVCALAEVGQLGAAAARGWGNDAAAADMATPVPYALLMSAVVDVAEGTIILPSTTS